MAISTVRARYIAYAQQAFPFMEPILSAKAGIEISLKLIGEQELLETERWRTHPACRALWSWRQVIRKLLRTPKHISTSFYCKGLLCGLMIATISKTRVNVNITHVEASPDPEQPLKSQFLNVALFQAEVLAALLNARQVSISNPVLEVIDRYLMMGYRRNARDRKRQMRGMRPRDRLLLKDVDSALHFDWQYGLTPFNQDESKGHPHE